MAGIHSTIFFAHIHPLLDSWGFIIAKQMPGSGDPRKENTKISNIMRKYPSIHPASELKFRQMIRHQG